MRSVLCMEFGLKTIADRGTRKGFVSYWSIAFCDSKKVSLVQRNFKALANRNVISNPGSRANLRVNKSNQGERAERTRANLLSESKPEQIAFPVLTLKRYEIEDDRGPGLYPSEKIHHKKCSVPSEDIFICARKGRLMNTSTSEESYKPPKFMEKQRDRLSRSNGWTRLLLSDEFQIAFHKGLSDGVRIIKT